MPARQRFPDHHEPQAGSQTEAERLSDHRLDAALGRLPQEHAGSDFTDRVLSRVSEAESSRSRWRSLAAAALLFTTAGLAAGEWNERLEQQAAAERLASLRAEYGLLQEELRELQEVASQGPDLVYLGGNEEVDYVLDLSRLAAARGSAPQTKPAAF